MTFVNVPDFSGVRSIVAVYEGKSGPKRGGVNCESRD